MARLAGIDEAVETQPRSRDLIREGLQEYFSGGIDDDEMEEADECETSSAMTEARLRKVLSREIRAAIEELRKSRGKPIVQLKRRSRLL
jgi:hypothetical protein